MTSAAARRLWVTLEPLHDVVYFAPGIREAGLELGLRGYWMTYFAFRAAPLGPVGSEPVVAMFGGFHPDMVAKALPDAWSRVSPQMCVQRRAEVSAEALSTLGVNPSACRSALEVLAPVAAEADPTGRPLFAANAAIEVSSDPLAGLWQVATSLREHRGDGHIAALVAAGISGLEAHLLQVGAGRYPSELIRTARGWSATDWSEAAERLRERGLLSGEAVPRLTETGSRLRTEIERRTDDAAWTGGLARLGEAAVDEVVARLRPCVAAIDSSGILPEFNPTGLPRQLPLG